MRPNDSGRCVAARRWGPSYAAAMGGAGPSPADRMERRPAVHLRAVASSERWPVSCRSSAPSPSEPPVDRCAPSSPADPAATPGDPRHERWSTPQRSSRAVKRQVASGSLDAARTELDRLARIDPDSLRVHELRLDVLERQGNPRRRSSRSVEGEAPDERPQPRRDRPPLAGWLTVTDPAWLPRSAGSSDPIAEPIPDRVLHLIAEPTTEDGAAFVAWHEQTVRAQVAAGLHPVVVTTLGSARTPEDPRGDRTRTVRGAERYRLDLGAAYPLDGPVDTRLDNSMWLLTRLVRRERPAIVHVASRLERPDEVLLGLGLRAQVGLPLVIALAPGHEPAITPGSKGAGSPAGDRIDARVQSTIARCVAAADGLVVADAVGVTALRGSESTSTA